MITEKCYWIFCFSPISTSPADKIFGFSEFLTAVALMTVIYAVTDVRYKFRIAVTAIPLYSLTFYLTAIIGFLTLMTEVWITNSWWVPKTSWWFTSATWQAILGLLFLSTILTWMYWAFISPPVFGQRNAHRFARELYKYILRGNDEELKVIANELVRSVRPLIRYSKRLPSRSLGKDLSQNNVRMQASIEDYAHDLLLLIANRKFCRQIVAASPVTVQAFFEEMVNENKYDIPIGPFVRNISCEAIAQKGSFLYVEAEGYSSGLQGYLQLVSLAVYGNYQLVKALEKNYASPLHIHYEERWEWDAKQWEAYCRATLFTLKDFLKNECNWHDAYALKHSFENIENAYSDLYKLNGMSEVYNSDICKRLCVAVKFIKDAIDLINEQNNLPNPQCRVRGKNYPKDIYDHLAILILDICFATSKVKSPPETCWLIHHNIVWSAFFGIGDLGGEASKIVRFKVRRLLYDEIAQLAELPNYKGAGVLGFCLQVLGLKTDLNKNQYQREVYALAKATHSWTRKNYLHMRQKYPDVAESALIGSLSFDKDNNRLVKTYRKGLNQEAPKDYLYLDLNVNRPGFTGDSIS